MHALSKDLNVLFSEYSKNFKKLAAHFGSNNQVAVRNTEFNVNRNISKLNMANLWIFEIFRSLLRDSLKVVTKSKPMVNLSPVTYTQLQ